MAIFSHIVEAILCCFLTPAAIIFLYLAYKLVYRPNLVRAALRQHPRVYISPNATFLGGDMSDSIGGLNDDKRHVFSRFEEAVLESPERYDMFFQTLGSEVLISLCSI